MSLLIEILNLPVWDFCLVELFFLMMVIINASSTEGVRRALNIRKWLQRTELIRVAIFVFGFYVVTICAGHLNYLVLLYFENNTSDFNILKLTFWLVVELKIFFSQ